MVGFVEDDDAQIPIGWFPEAQTQGFSKNLACKAVDVIKAWKGWFLEFSTAEKVPFLKKRYQVGTWKTHIMMEKIWWCNDQVERIKLYYWEINTLTINDIINLVTRPRYVIKKYQKGWACHYHGDHNFHFTHESQHLISKISIEA